VKLHSLLTEDTILNRVSGRDRDEAIRELVERLPPLKGTGNREDLLAKLMEREKLGTTAIGGGVAIPHCKVRKLKAPIVALGLSRPGIPFAAADGRDVHVIFLVISPQENPSVNLRLLASVAKLVRNSGRLVARLLERSTPKEVLEILEEEEGGRHA
jgi:mannitol/fructose-specific phosphotransferase system IIA component (Ntr-type)